MPSVLHLLLLLAAPENRPPEKAAEIMHLLFGTQAYTGDFHLSGFTPTLLVKLLRDAGLLICNAAIRDSWLFEIKAKKAANLTEPEELVHQYFFEALDRPAPADAVSHFAAGLRDGKLTPDKLFDSLRGSDEARFILHHPTYLIPYIGKKINIS